VCGRFSGSGFLFHFFVSLFVCFLSVFCLNQDLQDIRDFQDGRLIVCGRFSGSGFLFHFFVSLFVYLLSVFCLNQDLQDIRDFQDGPLRVGVVGLVVRGCFCLTFLFHFLSVFCLFFV
jgi:hypothetical protein